MEKQKNMNSLKSGNTKNNTVKTIWFFDSNFEANCGNKVSMGQKVTISSLLLWLFFDYSQGDTSSLFYVSVLFKKNKTEITCLLILLFISSPSDKRESSYVDNKKRTQEEEEERKEKKEEKKKTRKYIYTHPGTDTTKKRTVKISVDTENWLFFPPLTLLFLPKSTP